MRKMESDKWKDTYREYIYKITVIRRSLCQRPDFFPFPPSSLALFSHSCSSPFRPSHSFALRDNEYSFQNIDQEQAISQSLLFCFVYKMFLMTPFRGSKCHEFQCIGNSSHNLQRMYPPTGKANTNRKF